MSKKQIPSITVNTRVPEPLFRRLDNYIIRQRLEGVKVTKNGVYVEALELYMQYLEEVENNVEEQE